MEDTTTDKHIQDENAGIFPILSYCGRMNGHVAAKLDFCCVHGIHAGQDLADAGTKSGGDFNWLPRGRLMRKALDMCPP